MEEEGPVAYLVTITRDDELVRVLYTHAIGLHLVIGFTEGLPSGFAYRIQVMTVAERTGRLLAWEWRKSPNSDGS